jgi:hypothetical protein
MARCPHAILPTLATALAAGAFTPAPAATVTTLYQFTGRADGGSPSGPLLLDAAGDLYGTTLISGRARNGVVFRLTPGPSGTNWTETVLYNFPRAHFVDASANGGLMQDTSAALYGTAFGNDIGFAYRLAPPALGGSTWRYMKIYGFSGLGDGGGPSGPLILTRFGQLVGVTQAGGDVSGNNACDCGVVYVLTPPTNGGAWQETVAHTFLGRPDGYLPSGALAADADGALYGTTYQGGSGHCVDHIAKEVTGCGTVYRLTPSGASWTETILYEFQPDDADYPTNSVVFGPDGALYGSAGSDVFRLAADTQGNWQKTVIYAFPRGKAGEAPGGGVIFDAEGNIYGTTNSTGLSGHATAFELAPPSTGSTEWTRKTLATFSTNVNGPQPSGGLIRGPDGTLYGAIATAPSAIYGYIFAIKP